MGGGGHFTIVGATIHSHARRRSRCAKNTTCVSGLGGHLAIVGAALQLTAFVSSTSDTTSRNCACGSYCCIVLSVINHAIQSTNHTTSRGVSVDYAVFAHNKVVYTTLSAHNAKQAIVGVSFFSSVYSHIVDGVASTVEVGLECLAVTSNHRECSVGKVEVGGEFEV